MLDNLNWWEIGALLIIALLIFGDRLPTVIADGLRLLRNVRNMARNATADLSRELGTDIQLEDLHPKTFIRKHLLSEDEEAALRKPFQEVLDSVRDDLRGVRKELEDVASTATITPRQTADDATGTVAGATGTAAANRVFDTDAT
jgi:sec-independent protein translocase protein TatB